MKLFKKRRPAIAKFDPYQTALQQSMESDRQEVLEKTATGPIFTLMGVPYIFDPAQGVLCKAGRRRAPSPGQLGLFGGHNEGDTKVEDGVTYRLNANSRWERMDKPKASGKRKPKPAIVPVVEAEKLMPEVVDDAPKPTRLGDRIRAIANDLRDENDEQKKIAARILGAAAQMAQNYDNLVGEVVDMVGEDLGEDIRSLNPDATQADVEMAARDGGSEPSPTRLADKMKAIADDLRNETNEQVKATARILDAAAQIAQNYDNLVDEVAEMVGEDLEAGGDAIGPAVEEPDAPTTKAKSRRKPAETTSDDDDSPRQRRAKAGGEYGPNGEWYEGGKFIPYEDKPKVLGSKKKAESDDEDEPEGPKKPAKARKKPEAKKAKDTTPPAPRPEKPEGGSGVSSRVISGTSRGGGGDGTSRGGGFARRDELTIEPAKVEVGTYSPILRYPPEGGAKKWIAMAEKHPPEEWQRIGDFFEDKLRNFSAEKIPDRYGKPERDYDDADIANLLESASQSISARLGNKKNQFSDFARAMALMEAYADANPKLEAYGRQKEKRWDAPPPDDSPSAKPKTVEDLHMRRLLRLVNEALEPREGESFTPNYTPEKVKQREQAIAPAVEEDNPPRKTIKPASLIEDHPIDLLPKYFRGIVIIGLPNGSIYMGLKGQFHDKDEFKKHLPDAKWQPVSETKSWLVKMTNANQKEVFRALKRAKEEMGLWDVAIEGVRGPIKNSILSTLRKLEILEDPDALTKSLPPAPVFTLMGVPYIFDPHRAVLRKAGTSWEQFVADLSKEADDDPCWEGYEAVGMKKKRGKMVPNCVPVDR
jgi:hypothetical protein